MTSWSWVLIVALSLGVGSYLAATRRLPGKHFTNSPGILLISSHREVSQTSARLLLGHFTPMQTRCWTRLCQRPLELVPAVWVREADRGLGLEPVSQRDIA